MCSNGTDMAVSNYWVTGDRLQMVTFTKPLCKLFVICFMMFFLAKKVNSHPCFPTPQSPYFIVQNPIVLVIPEPQMDDSLSAQTYKVLEPFTWGAWCLILAMIFVAAFMSVFLLDKSKLGKKNGRGLRHERRQIKKKYYGRLALDAFIEKGTVSCTNMIMYQHSIWMAGDC